ncbi:hypothetical protein BH24ACT5_BH24ACT5_06950 [soil metagenome]
MLIVLRGLPGSGKSAVAVALGRRLKAPVLSVDPIEAAIWRAGVPPSHETGVAAYEVAAAMATEQLRLGHDVVIDAVNAYAVTREMWDRVAARAGMTMSVIEVVCSDIDVHRRRLEARVRDIDGFPEPTWDEVTEKASGPGTVTRPQAATRQPRATQRQRRARHATRQQSDPVAMVGRHRSPDTSQTAVPDRCGPAGSAVLLARERRAVCGGPHLAHARDVEDRAARGDRRLR